MRILTVFFSCFLLAIGIFTCCEAQAVPLDHTFHLTLTHSSGASFAIPPSISALEVTAPSQSMGNPLYEGQTAEKTNALYEPSSNSGSPGSVISVRFTFGRTQSLHSEGIVHRDIAARNLVVTTDEGVYESEVDATFMFMNDGPADLRGVGPVRWMAPESIRTRTYSTPLTTGGALQTGYWELSAGSFFDVSYPIPEPSTLLLACLDGCVLITRNRKMTL